MPGPYEVMGVKFEDTDEAIRSRYLELIRQYPPEHHAERFNRIRDAYEKIKTLQLRIDYRLYTDGSEDTVDDVIADVFSKLPRRRIPFAKLVEAYHKANQ